MNTEEYLNIKEQDKKNKEVKKKSKEVNKKTKKKDIKYNKKNKLDNKSKRKYNTSEKSSNLIIPKNLYPKLYSRLINDVDSIHSTPIKFSNADFGLFNNYKIPEQITELNYNLFLYNQGRVDYDEKYIKSFLNTDQFERWLSYNYFDFKSNNVIGQNLRQKYNIKKRGWTNAFRKMYEIIEVYNLIDKRNTKLNHFDICGYPGGFIFGTNYYLKTRTNNKEYNWYVTSYREDNSKDPDEWKYFHDQYGLHRKYPDKFIFGSEETNYNGDITDKRNIKEYQSFFTDNKHKTSTNKKESDTHSGIKLDLVTSDCGLAIDFEKSFTREEQMAKIYFGQLICGLATLKKGGHIVMKTYKILKPFSISLLYLVCCLFENVYLSKPESSNQSTGSEVYIIGKNYYQNLSNSNINKLLDILDKFNNELDINKSLISFDKMNSKLLDKIHSTIDEYYNLLLKRKIARNKVMKTGDHILKKNVNKYLYMRGKMYEKSIKERSDYYDKYFKRMKYQYMLDEYNL